MLLSVKDKGKVSGRFICSSLFIVSHLETSARRKLSPMMETDIRHLRLQCVYCSSLGIKISVH